MNQESSGKENTNKKRILIFSLVYYPNFIGGAEVAIKEITDRLGGADFDMVTLRFDRSLPKVEKIGNVTVYRVGFTSFSNKKISPDNLPFYLNLNKFILPITGFFKAFFLHRKNNYDCFWSMMATYNSFGALFMKLVFKKVPFILTLQEGDPIPYIKKKARIVWPLFVSVFRKADYIQAISKYLAGFAREMGSKSPIFIVPNGVDIENFTREFPEKELVDLEKRLQKKEKDIFMITTSRLVSKNDVASLVSAMLYLPPKIKLLVAGSGPLEGGLRAQAKNLGVDDRIKFLGWVSHADMPKYLQVSDIFIRTPISEGFGNSYVEAMAAGLPCIATPVGGIVDFIKDEETGLFAEVRDPKSIADAVNKLMKGGALVKKIKINAFKMVTEKYDWDIIARQMGGIFEKVTNDQ